MNFRQKHRDLVHGKRYYGRYPTDPVRIYLTYRGKEIGSLGLDAIGHYPPDPVMEAVVRLGGTP